MSEVAVVGGGVIGCAVAWELARRGARVDLFDSRPLGAGATQASAGMLVPYLEAHGAGPLRDLGVRSAAMFGEYVARLREESTADVEFRRPGSLQLAMDADAAALLRACVTGNSPLEWLDAAAVRQREPAVSSSCAGAVLASPHGYVVVSSLVEALAEAASRHGARLHVGRGVSAIDAVAGEARLAFDDGTSGRFARVIVCAGSWTPKLGLDDAAARAVRPVRGQLVRLRWSGEAPRHIIWGPGCYVVPWSDGTVLVGATMEEVGYDERTTAAGVRDLLDAACDLLPDAWGATFLDARAGLRPASSDGLPIVGPSPRSDAIVYATGHSRHGIMLAPLTAQLVAEFVLEGKRDAAMTVLAPERFS